MADPAQRLREDRALRDAARALVTDDIGFIRDSLAARSIPARIVGRIGSGAQDIAGEATLVAQENRTALGAGLAVGALGVAAWLFRGRLTALAEKLLGRNPVHAEPQEPDAGSTRSRSE